MQMKMSISGEGCSRGRGEILSFDGRDGAQVQGYIVRPESPDTVVHRGVLVLGDVFGIGEESNMKWCDALSVMRFVPSLDLRMCTWQLAAIPHHPTIFFRIHRSDGKSK